MLHVLGQRCIPICPICPIWSVMQNSPANNTTLSPIYMDTQWVCIFAAATLLVLYLLLVNRSLTSTPEKVQSISPTRFDQVTIKRNYERLLENPISVDLPPRTGRRYIVVGGAGFLSGVQCPATYQHFSCIMSRLDRGSTIITRGGPSTH